MWLALAALLLAAPSPDDVLARLDARQQAGGDFKALVQVEQRTGGQVALTREALVYRRDASGQLLVIVTRPSTEQGKAALRVEGHLWSYVPRSGRWEGRGEQDALAGTGLRGADLDVPRLAERYIARVEAEESLEGRPALRLLLSARPGVAVPSPLVRLWVERASGSLWRRDELSASGEVLRTATFTGWQRLFSEAKRADVWYPVEVHLRDARAPGRVTVVRTRSVDLRPLPANVLTRAWAESRSR